MRLSNTIKLLLTCRYEVISCPEKILAGFSLGFGRFRLLSRSQRFLSSTFNAGGVYRIDSFDVLIDIGRLGRLLSFENRYAAKVPYNTREQLFKGDHCLPPCPLMASVPCQRLMF
ncbi:hypothetical protein PGT21_016298 [Puccinia graminis f. sp. tritici]|uniref:Uncharacterized protein n=1 Tax=Puccinia graminis f. sp. tritici TaxID=56615 RepID=A0A5B0S0G9_PUCGR|nr:hypothetical protein PGT21_016298 [Puccinia graminis f. sp. tritici]KAA1131621.1 hypothetical protein PGTUg99_033705 [Puccinia graminis f. sp. tritici]